MKKKIIRPIKGIDQDSSLNRRDDQSIFESRNLRLNSSDSISLGYYSNIKGDNLAITIPDGDILLKIAKVKDFFVFFIKTASRGDIIAILEESNLPKNGEPSVELNLIYLYGLGGNLVYGPRFDLSNKKDLGFDVNKDIIVKTYYESDSVLKIYWVIDGEPLRSFNILNPSTELATSDIEVIPGVDMEEPQIISTVSGNLKTGKVFYTYILTNSIGLESSVAPISKGVHLTQSSEKESNDYNYKGYGFDVDSKKGVKFKIENINLNFQKIKIYAIHYINDVSLPIVRLIYDDAVSEEITFSDTGSALLEISAEEFISLNNIYIKNGILEIKNNRLFIANYNENYFDIDDYAIGNNWDSRAYRFLQGGGDARVYDKDLTTYVDIPGNTTTYPLVLNHDAINISNDIKNYFNTNSSTRYLYRQNSTFYGATGKNIEIFHFMDSSKGVIPDYSDQSIKWFSKKNNEVPYILTDPSSSYGSYANPYLAGNYRTFKPLEIYRFAIQFKNNRNQYSYPKWICDYRVPFEDNLYYTGDTGEDPSNVKLKMLINRVGFSVNNIPDDPETGSPFEWRIVMVPIEEEDEGVHWGLFNNLFKAPGLDNYSAIYNRSKSETRLDSEIWKSTFYENQSNNGKYLEFISPDYCMGNKVTYSHINIISHCTSSNVIGDLQESYNSNVHKIYKFSPGTAEVGFSYVEELLGQYNVEYDNSIKNNIQLDGSDKLYRAGYTIAKFKSGEIEGKKYLIGNSSKGRCQILYPGSTTDSNTQDNIMYYGCSFIDNFEGKYGGLSYEARSNNGYIPIMDFTNLEGSTVYTYGDSYLGCFEYLRQISDNNQSYINTEDEEIIDIWSSRKTPGGNEILIFPTCSRINLNLRSDNFFTKAYTNDGAYMMHEYSGVYEDPDVRINPSEEIFAQETDLYLYNKTYSRDQDTLKHYPKLRSSSIQEEFKNRIISSNQKILGELSDSFMKFGNSYIDVDGRYGEITGLIIFNEKLFFTQEKAIGTVAVNEKATTNLLDESSIVIGELGVLSRYDYITYENGVSNSNHLMSTNIALYFIDSVKKEFLKISSKGIENISITGNINSLLKSYDFSNAKIIYNRKYNEVLFYVKESSSDTRHVAIVYNEDIGRFTSIYNTSGFIINSANVDKNDLFSEIIIDNTNSGRVLNDGNYNNFGDFYDASEITFLVPSENENVVMFNVLESIIKQVDSNGDSVDFIDTIRIYNDDFDTGELDFETNSKLKFGKYRTNKLRDYNGGTNSRFLSDHIYVTIKTKDNNSTNYKAKIRDLIVSFNEYNYFG